jgi:hypothetical protein
MKGKQPTTRTSTMKAKNLLSLFLLFLPFLASAEYNGHQIEFNITLTDGKEIHGHNYLAMVHRRDESIGYQGFLEQNPELVLQNQFNDSVGEWTYFEHRIRYDYLPYGGDSSFIYPLIDKKSVEKHAVAALTIIGLTDQSYAIGVSSGHEYEDRVWMASKPVESHFFGGLFCSTDIFIHEKTAATDLIIRELEKISADFEQEVKAQEEEMKYADGEAYDQAAAKLEQIEEAMDGNISAVLQRFAGLKVVMITMCTC